MPSSTLLTARTYAYLETVPVEMREDPDIIAVAYCYAQEYERQMQFLDRVQANTIASTADSLTFKIWEALFGLNAGASTDAQRSLMLKTFLRAQDGTGAGWISLLTQLIGADWTYAEHVPGVASTPAQETIVVTVTFSASSENFRLVQTFLAMITPVNIQFILQNAAGFVLDLSQLDTQPL